MLTAVPSAAVPTRSSFIQKVFVQEDKRKNKSLAFGPKPGLTSQFPYNKLAPLDGPKNSPLPLKAQLPPHKSDCEAAIPDSCPRVPHSERCKYHSSSPRTYSIRPCGTVAVSYSGDRSVRLPPAGAADTCSCLR